MSLLERMFGFSRRIDIPTTGGVAMPTIKPTRLQQSMVEVGPSHLATSRLRVPLFHSAYRRLERNKYALWGRGDLSGLPV